MYIRDKKIKLFKDNLLTTKLIQINLGSFIYDNFVPKSTVNLHP